MPRWIAVAFSPSARVMATRMRWISDCSSSRRRTSSLFCSMVSRGSTKTVWPEEDEPWMTPGTLAFELSFDGDDEAVAANGDEVVLGAAAFAEAAQGLAKALFDGAVLALHGAANAAEFGGGVVVEAAVGFDLPAQIDVGAGRGRDRGVVMKVRRCRAIRSACCWGRVDEVAPCGDAFDDGEEVADLGGFQGGAVDAGLIEEDGGVEEAVELEAAAAGEHGAQFGGALLLLVDPGEIGAGFECKDPCAAQRGDGAAGDVVAEAGPFQGRRA